MNIKNFIRKMKKRLKLFLKALEKHHMNGISESVVPPIYYLLYDEEEIVEWNNETIRQVRELLKEDKDKE